MPNYGPQTQAQIDAITALLQPIQVTIQNVTQSAFLTIEQGDTIDCFDKCSTSQALACIVPADTISKRYSIAQVHQQQFFFIQARLQDSNPKTTVQVSKNIITIGAAIIPIFQEHSKLALPGTATTFKTKVAEEHSGYGYLTRDQKRYATFLFGLWCWEEYSVPGGGVIP